MGFKEVIPQQKAGFLTEPPISFPIPKGDIPDPKAEPSPPLEPPAVKSGCQGLRVNPCKGLLVLTRNPSSGRLVRAKATAPALRIRSTNGASTVEIRLAKIGKP